MERDVELYVKKADTFREVYEINDGSAKLGILVYAPKGDGAPHTIRPSNAAIRRLCEITGDKKPDYIK